MNILSLGWPQRRGTTLPWRRFSGPFGFDPRRRRVGGSGSVCGLVVVTPGSGFVDQTGAFLMGAVSAPVVYYGLQLKVRVRPRVTAARRKRVPMAWGIHGWEAARGAGGWMRVAFVPRFPLPPPQSFPPTPAPPQPTPPLALACSLSPCSLSCPFIALPFRPYIAAR